MDVHAAREQARESHYGAKNWNCIDAHKFSKWSIREAEVSNEGGSGVTQGHSTKRYHRFGLYSWSTEEKVPHDESKRDELLGNRVAHLIGILLPVCGEQVVNGRNVCNGWWHQSVRRLKHFDISIFSFYFFRLWTAHREEVLLISKNFFDCRCRLSQCLCYFPHAHKQVPEEWQDRKDVAKVTSWAVRATGHEPCHQEHANGANHKLEQGNKVMSTSSIFKFAIMAHKCANRNIKRADYLI